MCEVKLGVLNDSELIGTMYLSLKSLIGWIMTTPTLYFDSKLGLFQFLYMISKQNVEFLTI